MTKTLKKRFIVFTLTAITCLLVFLVLAINGLNAMMQKNRADMVLKTLVDADGTFHKMDFPHPPPFSRPIDMDKMRSSRFFIVRTDAEGNVLDVNIDQISSIDRDSAETHALNALKTGKTSGRVDGYKFAAKQIEEGSLLFFMDTSEQWENFYTVLLVSSSIAVLCWLIVLIVVLLLSGKVIRPVIVGMEKQKQFITNAGHEMKTPLAIIQSNNDTMVLLHGENKYNIHIRNQTKRLNVLMSNLLTLAKLDEEIALPAQTVRLSEVAAEYLPLYEQEAQRRSISFDEQVEPDLTAHIHKDSFCQLLTILLDNALKYTPDKGTIHVSLTKTGRRIRLVTENTCDPSLEPNPEKFFDRFYRGDAARTQSEHSEGYGIGLSAARAICEQFGGTLTVRYPDSERIQFTAKF